MCANDIAVSFFRRFYIITALGSLGVLTLAYQPIPRGLSEDISSVSGFSHSGIKLLLLINPMFIMVVAAIVGSVLAHKVGLKSILAGTAVGGGRYAGIQEGLLSGFVLGALLIFIDKVAMIATGSDVELLAPADSFGAVIMKIFYGGVTEEVMLRWGCMSLVLWILMLLFSQEHKFRAVVFSILLSSLIFAFAHLPALLAHSQPELGVVLRSLVINSLAGCVYGWLFWRFCIEAAMVAHMCTHLCVFVVMFLIL